jgi:hypothetical protein
MGRKEDAARLRISDMLIRIAQNGRDYEPFVTEYDDRLSKPYQELVNFKVNDKLYTLTLTNLQSDVAGVPEAQYGLMVLERLGRTFYEARVYESTRLTGGWFSYSRPGEVLTYLPGKWVEEFQEVLANVDRQGER